MLPLSSSSNRGLPRSKSRGVVCVVDSHMSTSKLGVVDKMLS